eukprot:5499801-Amphidinium_carterae.1
MANLISAYWKRELKPDEAPLSAVKTAYNLERGSKSLPYIFDDGPSSTLHMFALQVFGCAIRRRKL